jgi:hypothetical protein
MEFIVTLFHDCVSNKIIFVSVNCVCGADHFILSNKNVFLDRTMATKRFEIFTIEMRDDGILHLHADGDQIIDMRLYEVLINGIAEMSGGKRVPILSTTDDLTLPDEEVKSYFMKPEANPYCLANALIAPSLPQKLLSNLFIRIMRPARPIKLFRTKEEAIVWLKTFL